MCIHRLTKWQTNDEEKRAREKKIQNTTTSTRWKNNENVEKYIISSKALHCGMLSLPVARLHFVWNKLYPMRSIFVMVPAFREAILSLNPLRTHYFFYNGNTISSFIAYVRTERIKWSKSGATIGTAPKWIVLYTCSTTFGAHICNT